VENINRNFTYKDIRETFNQYGPTKNIRINIDQRTGRFMGSVLIYYAENTKINEVMDNIRQHPIKYDFRVVAVSSEEAEKIIASFTNKDLQ
jgi:RNA recognition motif-containing protein